MNMVIVGGSVAGIATARQLRRTGYEGAMCLVEAEPHLPYDKPPLSKQMLAAHAAEPVPLATSAQLEALDLDLRLNTRALSLDAARQTITTSDGAVVEYGTLVVATGLVARTLPLPTPPGVYTLRTLDDALAIHGELTRSSRLVIVGAGFIGAELATAARAQGVDVVIVETQDVPMLHLFGAEVAGELTELHAANDVRLATGVQVARFDSDGPDGAGDRGRVRRVVLSDGSSLAADFVVVAIGARPALDWLASSGLDGRDGLRCDGELRVDGVENVYAAGDIARWPHGLYGDEIRIEHWTNATEHAAIVAASILGQPAPEPQVPYVWSDQYRRLLQIVGQPRRGSLAVRTGTLAAGGQYTAVFDDADGYVVGAVCVDFPKAMIAVRKAIKRHTATTELQLPEPSGLAAKPARTRGHTTT